MIALKNKALIKINTLQKETYALTNDVNIHIQRGYNFNLREDRGGLGWVINGEGLPEGARILVNYLALEPTYHVPNYGYLSEKEVTEGYKIINIPMDMAFCYKVKNEWIPCENYLITQRIYKPYKGILAGVGNLLVKNRMFVISGFDEYDGEKNDLSGQVAVTLDNADYEVTFHDLDNKAYSLIRTRWREIEALDGGMTKDLLNGKYLIGSSPTDCKTLN